MKNRKKRILFLIYILCILNAFVVYAQPKYTFKVLLIPLDDRPPCLQFPVKMGLIGDVEIVTPPRDILGRFTKAGQPEELMQWALQQKLTSFDAAIISMDMLAFGGLVASRVHETAFEKALVYLELITEIRQNAPQIKIYGSSVIMRLAPTGDGKNEAYREKLARWATISADKKGAIETAKLELEIPSEALANYKKARERNLKVNLLAIDLVKKEVFDYLILSQDDAQPKGVHIKDRETLIDYAQQNNLTEKVAIQPGADEVSMLLLARSLTDKTHYHPKVKAIYSTEKVAQQVMPYEDRPLSKTVSFHLKAVGAEEVFDETQADILFYVFASRFDEGRSKSFAEEIIQTIKTQPKKGIIIADVDPKGAVQGGDTTFTEALKAQHIFSKIYGYACWNTAGNTIGTALPHGIIYGVSKNIFTKNKKRARRTEGAQTWFMLNRLLDDYTYHSIIRPKMLKEIKDNKWNAFRLTDEQTTVIKAACLTSLEPMALELAANYFNSSPFTKSQIRNPKYTEGGTKRWMLSNFTFNLPWNRTFEAEIDFNIR
jgi:hypothetical protein